VGFEGGEAVAEVGERAVEGDSGKVTYRGDGGAEWAADLSFESVELGVGEEAELEGQVFSDEESTDDPDSAGLC
jgi:hypothetical protein